MRISTAATPENRLCDPNMPAALPLAGIAQSTVTRRIEAPTRDANRWPNPFSAKLRGVTREQSAATIEAPLRHFLARWDPSPDAVTAAVRHPSLVDALSSSQELTRLVVDGNVHALDLVATLDRWPADIDDARGRDEALFDLYRMAWARTPRGAAHAALLDTARASIAKAREPYFVARKMHEVVMDAALDVPRFQQRLEQLVPLGPPHAVDRRLAEAMARQPELMQTLDRVLRSASGSNGEASLVGRDASPQRIARGVQLLAKPRFLAAALLDTENAFLNYAMLMSAAYADRTIDAVVAAPHAEGAVVLDASLIEAALRREEMGERSHAWLSSDAPLATVIDRVAELPCMAHRDRLHFLLQPGVLTQLAMHCDQPFGTPAPAPLAYALDELRHGLPRSADDATGEITTVEVMDALLPKPFGATTSVTDWICLSLDDPRNRDAVEAYVSVVCRAAASAGDLFRKFLASQFRKPLVLLPPSVAGRPPSVEDSFFDTMTCGDTTFAQWCRDELRAADLISSMTMFSR